MTDTTPPKALTPKQRAWAEHYASSGNGTSAARSAGYKGNDATLKEVGRENLLKPAVVAYLATLTSPGTNARIADATERQEFWTSIMRGEVTEMYFKDGRLLEKPTELTARLKASELLGKRQGDFTEKLELTGKDGLPIQQQIEHSLEGKTLEELAALYKTWG